VSTVSQSDVTSVSCGAGRQETEVTSACTSRVWIPLGRTLKHPNSILSRQTANQVLCFSISYPELGSACPDCFVFLFCLARPGFPVVSQKVDSFPGLGKEMEDGRDFSPENRPALDDIYGVKSGGAKSVAA